jgi:ACR3 family arsenite efflux pump ArsB
MNQIEGLISELKVKIIQTLGLIVMMIEKIYGVKIESKELGSKVFASVRALAAHILANQRQKA